MNALSQIYSLIKSKHISGYLVALILIIPNVVWAALDRSLWWGDRSGYALQSVSVYVNMITSFSSWKGSLFNYYKAPMIFWVGEFFVPLGKLIGSINFSLLLIPLISSYITLVLLFKSFEILFKNRLIAFCGCLIVAASPLFNELSRGFWIEPMQIAIVTWFIYALLRVSDWSFYFSLAQFIIAISLALLIKVSSPLYLIAPSVAFWINVYRVKPSMIINKKEAAYLAISLLPFCLAAAFYLHNFNDILGFVHYAASSPLFGVGTPKIDLWTQTMNDKIFMHWTYTLSILLLLFCIIRVVKHKKYYSFRSAFIVSLFQIVIFFIVWIKSPNDDTRYFLPTLPYFAVIICWGLATLGSRIYTAIWIAIFLIQYATVNGLALGLIKTQNENGVILPLQKESDNNAHIIQDMIPLATRDSSIIFDLNPAFGTCEFRYEMAKQDLTSNWGKCCIDISAFFNIFRQEVDTGKINVDSAWKDILSYNPDFYVTWSSRLSPDSAEKEIRTIDKYNAVTVPIRWAIAERIKKSGLYERVNFPSQKKLLIYKRKDIPLKKLKNVL